jgi:uncharacterized beta-barrel protein YwiB (DUF1934 family)
MVTQILKRDYTDSKGMALVLLILVIVLVVIVVAGLTGFVFESLRLATFKEQELKTVYLAQAGIMDAIVDYRDGNTWTKKTNVNVAGNQYYHVGKAANFLLVDASNILANGRVVNRWPIRNINGAASPAGDLTITSLVVSWTFGGNINKVKLGNTFVYAGPSVSSPANIDITDFTIAAGAYYDKTNDQYLHFDANVSGTVSVVFNFSDGSSYKALLLKNGSSVNKEFSITATGEVRGNATWRRTIEATYDTGTNTITSWQEKSSHIIP